MKMENDTDTGFIAIAALRYAIGRRSYAPGLVADWIKRHWGDFQDCDKTTMFKNLESEIESFEKFPDINTLGDPCDKKTWYALRDWMKENTKKAGEK